jgi:hypothetical protein
MAGPPRIGRAITKAPLPKAASSSGQGRLPESLHFAESDVILGAVRGEKCPQSQLWA